MNEYCDNCNTELDYFDNEWAKYNFSDCEELISIYKCPKCDSKFSKREGNFSLEPYDL